MLIKNVIRVERTDLVVLMVDNAVQASGLKGNLGFRSFSEMQSCIEKLRGKCNVMQAFVRTMEQLPNKAYLAVLTWDPRVKERAATYEQHGCLIGFERELEAREYFGREPEILHILSVS